MKEQEASRKIKLYKKPSPHTDLIKRAEIAEERVKSLRFNITKSERNILHLLEDLGYEFIFQYALFDEWYFIIADFYLPRFRIIIEVDGPSHLDKDKKKQERKRKTWLEKQGIHVLRIKNSATTSMTKEQLQYKIIMLYEKKNNKKS